MKSVKIKNNEYYRKMLSVIGSLSNLFSESKVPYLNYRVTENLFCKSFGAKNLSRADVSVDAVLNNKGIGVKTFVDERGNSYQKVAEFNRDLNLFKGLSPDEKVKKISELRNERLEATKRIYKLNNSVYHCIIRKEGLIGIYECEMDEIEIPKIKDIKTSKGSISFKDSKHEYSFSISKSTLLQKFTTPASFTKIPVKIVDDPFDLIEEKLSEINETYFKESTARPFIILALYSRTKHDKVVHEKSGLNQWNAGGRPRDYDEVYIQIPKWIHERFPGFFPPKDKPFNLLLPDGSSLSSKVCQENSKALMSNPNNALGKWLLRDILGLKKGELLTYEKLQEIGLDSVMIEKIDNRRFAIVFKKAGTYEEFLSKNK
ncbi:MAG: NgoFVII family restriction endonuclease [Nanoarchaeota archaeon]